MIEKVQRVGQIDAALQPAENRARNAAKTQSAFDAILRQKTREKETESVQTVNFSKHALARAEERGIELTPTLMDKLAGSVEKAQEKGANTILAFDDSRAFIINIPYNRVITTMSGDEMKENIFTNIDGAVLL